MLSTIPFRLALCGLLLTASPAVAQDANPKWFVRAGVTRLRLVDKIQLNYAGAPVPGAGIHTPTHYTPTVQFGRFVADHFAIALTVGVPPHISIYGRGALQPYGKLAETTYGPAVLTAQYHPLRSGPIRPYIGAGAAYMIIFSTKDGAFQNVSASNDLAPALEGGTDVMLTQRVGLFFDVKKAFLGTTARGTFGGAPVVGQVRLNPLALTTGIAVHF